MHGSVHDHDYNNHDGDNKHEYDQNLCNDFGNCCALQHHVDISKENDGDDGYDDNDDENYVNSGDGKIYLEGPLGLYIANDRSIGLIETSEMFGDLCYS